MNAGAAAPASAAGTATPPTRPRLAFLGVGWIGRHRLQAVAESGVAEIVAIADPDAAAAAAASDVAPDAAPCENLEALLATEPDGVVIATPNALHAGQALRALAAGAAVFCQKPLGRSAAETRGVVDAARAADRLLEVELSYRHTGAARAVRELVADGAIGRVYAARLVFHNAYGPDKAWFRHPRLAGGGCVMDLGVHLVDLALWTLGFPPVVGVSSRRFAGGERLAHGDGRAEDFATARLDLDTGAVVEVACSWDLHAGRDATIAADFHGSEGGASLHNLRGSFYDFAAERFRGTSAAPLAEPPDDWGGRAIVRWVERVAAGAAFDAAATELVAVAEVLDAILGR
ncbi:Gfo/Idh/MocA family oxidoreductase [soil metagenome]